MPDRTTAFLCAFLLSAAPAFAGDALENLVRQDCGSCHGITLKGGLGRPITAQALADWDAETVAQVVLNGMPGTAMPGWAGVISEVEARAIAEGLKKGTFQ